MAYYVQVVHGMPFFMKELIGEKWREEHCGKDLISGKISKEIIGDKMLRKWRELAIPIAIMAHDAQWTLSHHGLP
jgi:hypothetical protein